MSDKAGPWNKFGTEQETGPWSKQTPEKPETPDTPATNLIWSDITTDEELSEIATKHSVPLRLLQETAAYFGATKSDETPQDLVKQAAGFVGQASAVGLPQKLYKMSQHPQVEAALDEMSQLAQKKKSYLREAAEIFGGFGTGAVATKLGKAALPVFGAAAGLGSSQAGDELQNAAVGAVAAPVIGAAISKLTPAAAAIKAAIVPQTSALTKSEVGVEGLVRKKLEAGADALIKAEQAAAKSGDPEDLVKFLGEDRTAALLNPASSEFKTISSYLTEAGIPATNKNIAREVAKAKLDVVRADVMKRVGAETWEQAVKEQGGLSRLVDEVLPQIRQEQLAQEAIAESNLGKNIRKIGTLEGMLLKISDDKPLMKIIDRRLGGGERFSAELAIDDLSAKSAKYSASIKQEVDKLIQFDKQLAASKLSREDFGNMFRAGKAPEELTKSWNDMTTGMLSRANREGAGIEFRANYMRDQLLQPAELQSAIRTRADGLSKKYGLDVADMTPDQWNMLSRQGDVQELVRAVSLVTGKPVDDVNKFTNSFSNVMQDVAEYTTRLYSKLGAAMAKTGEIPQFIKEPDPIRGMESWVAMTYKNLATREPVERLRGLANIADEAGDTWTAKHLRDKVSDILGSRRDSLSGGAGQLANKWTAYWTAKQHPVLAQYPDYMRQISRQMYPNLLGGLNIKASLQNLATPALSSIPDVGVRAGTRAWWNGIAATRKHMMSSGRAEFEDFLAREGMIPANMGREMSELKMDTTKLGKLNQDSNDALMFGFNLSELLARGQSYYMGQELGQMISKNPAWGRQFISKLNSPGYRRTLQDALTRGDEASVRSQMSKYLNSNHLLNYNKANQSAFGRFIGPTFSAFQKWPSTMLGKVLQEYYDKGALGGSVEVTKKLLAPVIALSIADGMLRGEKPSPRSEKILGRKLSSMAPGSALKDVANFKPPALGVAGGVRDAASDILDGDVGKLQQVGRNAVMTFAPGAGWLKLFGDDLPLLMTGKKKKRENK